MELGLKGEIEPQLRDLLHQELVEPAREFLSRASKNIRRQLVTAGVHWAGGPDQGADDLGEALELIHSASLIIDDIQDASPMRRGAQAVHLALGVPKAINLANWLYFKGFEHVDRLPINESSRLAILRLFHRALLQGHAGQAVDLGTPISRIAPSCVSAVVEASVRLKTGALTGLAFSGGAVLGGLSESDLDTAFQIGEEIGVILQFLDDLRNLKPDALAPGKQFEDLQNQRPGLVWKIAAEHASASCWSDLIQAVERLPARAPVEQWLIKYAVVGAAMSQVHERMNRLKGRLNRPNEITDILQQLVNAYEKL